MSVEGQVSFSLCGRRQSTFHWKYAYKLARQEKGGMGRRCSRQKGHAQRAQKLEKGGLVWIGGSGGGGQSDWRGLGEVRLEKQVGSSQLLEVLTKDL